jgi:holin-like protein
MTTRRFVPFTLSELSGSHPLAMPGHLRLPIDLPYEERLHMLPTFIVLIAFQLCGEGIASLTGLPIPGPVIGMALLLVALMIGGVTSESLQAGARALLQYLPLLFVPAGVGIVAYLPLIAAEWLPITIALLCSSVLAIIATAWTMLAVERWLAAPRQAANDLTLSRGGSPYTVPSRVARSGRADPHRRRTSRGAL